MRLPPYLPKFAILAAGVAIGVVGAFAFRPAATGSGAHAGSGSIPITGKSADLGAALLQRVGSHLIADDRIPSDPGDGPIAFYAVPKPYGEALCRVDVYTIAPKVFRGQVNENEEWDDELKIERKYGLWKRPRQKGGDRYRACTAFRDFRHLIGEENPLSVERGTSVLEAIIENARTGKSAYKLSCTRAPREPDPTPIPCDPLAALRALSLDDLLRTEMKSETRSASAFVREDELAVGGGGIARAMKINGPLLATITVKDAQHIGRQSVDEADVLSVAIEISELD